MNLSEINLIDVYRQWKADLGPFQCFFRSAPFVSLQTYDDFVLIDENNKWNQKVLNKILEIYSDDNFIIVDLPLNDILDLALVLNNKYYIKPILNINLLFHSFGIVGNRNDINKLINNGLKLKAIKSSKFIMLIPYERYNESFNPKEFNNRLNNQFGIGEDDLPNVQMLKKLGYGKVSLLTVDKIKDDLKVYMNSINDGIRLEVIKVML